MSSGGLEQANVICPERSVDDLGELPLQAPQGLPGGLVFGQLAPVVLLPEPGVHQLDARGQVKGVVQGSVAGAAQSVTSDITAGGFDRGCSCVARVVPGRGEARDVAGVTQDLGGEHVADPKDLPQAGPAGGDRLCAPPSVGHEASVDPPDVGDEVSSQGLSVG